VLWTHLLSTVLGNSVYAFAAMLGLVLAGLWAGGVLGSRLGRGDRPLPGWILAGLYFLGSAALLATFDRWPQVPHAFTVWGAGLTTFAQGEVLRWIQAGIQVLPPAVVLGMVYPSLFRLEGFPLEDRAAFAGWMGASNSVGCIVGALATGFIFIPAWGSETCLLLVGGLCGALGSLLAWHFTRGPVRKAALAAGVLVLVLWAVQAPWNQLELTSGEHVYFRPDQVGTQTRLAFFQEDTRGGITTVVQNPAGTKNWPRPYQTLLTNGKFQGNDAWETDAQTGFALIPILQARSFRDACVIGLGVGRTAQVVESMGFGSIDVAEIAPGVAEAARSHFADLNGRVLEQPNVHLELEDGRNLLLLHPERSYDLITMELTSVWFAGATNLYSREFYQLAKARLRPGGIFQQWIQLHHIGPYEVGCVMATLHSVFPDVSFWVFGHQGILVASDRPQAVQPEAVARFLDRGAAGLGIAPDRARDYLGSVLASRLLAPEEMARLVANVPLVVNTDRNRFLEYATPRYNLSRVDHPAANLQALGLFAAFPDQAVAGSGPAFLAAMVSGKTALARFTPGAEPKVP
jgi:spermidine synthase